MTTDTSLESYERLNGWTAAAAPVVLCINGFSRNSVADIEMIGPGNFYLYTTLFCAFCGISSTEGAFTEQSALYRSASLLTGYTLDHLASPVGHRTETGHDYSHENIVLQKAPTQPPSRPRVGRW